MKRSAIGAAIAIVLCTCTPQAATPSASPTTAAPTASPAPISTATPSPTAKPSPTPVGAAPQAIRFADVLHGWVGTQDGIMGTNDGGATWDRQLTAGQITKLWVYDARRAWALGADHNLYRTADGTHWTPIVPTPNPPIAEIDAFNPDLLWAIGAATPSGPCCRTPQVGNVMRSDDGGGTWQVVGTHTMWSVCFDTATDGVGAEGRQLFRTADAGRTWLPIATIPVPDVGGPPWYPTVTCPNGSAFRVQVTAPDAAAGHAPYLVYRTNDAGRTWTLEFREPYTLGSVTPPNTPQLGSFPSTFGAFAGGRTWFITCTGALDAQEFLLLGATGETLGRGPVPIPGCAVSGQVIDQSHVVAIAGATSTVIATDDGGASWHAIYRGSPRQ